MRRFQISINLTAVTDENQLQEYAVYADSNNIWETICAGFSELSKVVQDKMGFVLPSFGRKESYKKQ